MKKIHSKSTGGFSLIEVLVSLFILMFCIFLIIEVFPSSVKAVRISRQVTLASHIARKELEYARQLNWDELVQNGSHLQSRQTTLNTTTNGITSSTTFKSFFNVSPLPDDPENVKIVKVVVKWDLDEQDRNVDRKRVEMELLVAKTQ